ncbi:potassium channel family protein [Stomatohabitans albus]|uniref:potassium channel family protein n=1 Tax=Stomatohabitans albus TaxID=3110766 RepID=UPI00300D55F5
MARLRDTLANTAAIAFAVAWAVPILWPQTQGDWADITVTISWVVLIVDVAMDWRESQSTKSYLKTHWIEVLAVFLPLLRPLRLVRLVLLIRKLDGTAASSFAGSVGAYLSSSATLIGFIAAVAILEQERGLPGSSINTFNDAAWWVMATMTTVGYGDVYPVSEGGRYIAMGLMICGIALLGGVTAMVTSIMTARVVKTEDHFDTQMEYLTQAIQDLNTLPSHCPHCGHDLR